MSLFGSSYTVLDDKGKSIGTVDNKKSAVIMARAVLGSVKKGNKVVYSARNPKSGRNAGPKSVRKSKKELKKKGWYVSKGQASRGATVKKNGAITYGVAIIGNAALSKAGFKTMDKARGYLKMLRSRGVLAGRAHEMLKIDNDAGRSTVVESKQNAGLFSKRKTKKARGQGGSDAWAGHVKAKSRATKAARKKKRTAANPAGKLKSKIAHMQPGKWYPTTVAGRKAKIQRKGSKLTIRTL